MFPARPEIKPVVNNVYFFDYGRNLLLFKCIIKINTCFFERFIISHFALTTELIKIRGVIIATYEGVKHSFFIIFS